MPSMAEIGGMIAATTVATCSVLRCPAPTESAGGDVDVAHFVDNLEARLGAQDAAAGATHSRRCQRSSW